MNRNWLALVPLLVSAASSSAASLQFNNISSLFFPGLTNRLTALAYRDDTNSITVVAVGEQGVVVRGVFASGQRLLTSTNWTTNFISSRPNLTTVASGGRLFVASGNNNKVYSSPDGVVWNTNKNKAFNNRATAAGIAWNNTNFVTVAMAPEIGWTSLPLTNSWKAAKFVNEELSFLESYRAVTAYGGNGFAACGVFGVVRLSTNGGLNWQPRIRGRIGQPDLLGIASGGNTLVCVGSAKPTEANGAKGVILASTDKGANWQVAHKNSSANTPLYAVAYTGSGFTATGKRGQILTSPDGTSNSWTVAPPSAWRGATNVTEDLFGTVFPTSGFMQGVGVLVGDHGSIILAGPVPLPPVSLGDQSVCAGDSFLPLVVRITNNVGTNLVVDWYDSPLNGTRLTNSSLSYTPLILNNNLNRTNTYWTETRDLRTDYVSANRTPVRLTIHARPTAEIISTNIVCNGSPSTITVRFKTGNPPWTLAFTDGFTTNVVTNSSPTLPVNVNFAVSVTNVFNNRATNWTYTLLRLTDRFCTNKLAGDLAGLGQVTVNPRPTAQLVTANTNICNGGAVNLQVNLSGIAPWILTWSDGFRQTNDASPAIRTVNPTNQFPNATTNFNYSLMAVSDTNCIANQPGDIQGMSQVTVNPRPTATMVSASEILCHGASKELTVNLTGLTNYWVLTWNDGFIQTNLTSQAVRTVTPTNSFVGGTANFSYSVMAVADPACGNFAGDISGTYSATVMPQLRVQNFTAANANICNGDTTELRVDVTGVDSRILKWTDGVNSYTNTNATSSFRMSVRPTNSLADQAATYTYRLLELSDTNGCMVQLTNTFTVNVYPHPSASVSGSTNLCHSGMAHIQVDLHGVGPWILRWSDGLIQSNVTTSPVIRTVTFNNTNDFNIVTNVYTLTALTGANGCAATSLGGSATVITYPLVSAVVDPDGWTMTPINSVTISVALTGVKPWTLAWSDGFVLTNVMNSPAMRTIQGTNVGGGQTDEFEIFVLTSVVDSGAGCPSDLTTNVTSEILLVATNPIVRVEGGLPETNAICSGGCHAVPVILNRWTNGTGNNTKRFGSPWRVTFSDGTITNVNSNDASVTNFHSFCPSSNATIKVTSVRGTRLTDSSKHSTLDTNLIDGSSTILVKPRPTANVIPATKIFCHAGTATNRANLTGVGDWMVVWSVTNNGVLGMLVTNIAMTNFDLLTATLTNTSDFGIITNIYAVTALTDATNCAAMNLTGTTTVIVYPRLSATVDPAGWTMTTNDSREISVTLTGAKPWTLRWDDGITQSNVMSSITNRVIYGTNIAKLTNNITYTLTNVADASPCPLALTTNNSSTFVLIQTNFTVRVEGGLDRINTVCSGVCYAIPITLGNWTVDFFRTYGSPWSVTFSDGVTTNDIDAVNFNYLVCPTSNVTVTVTRVTGTRLLPIGPLRADLDTSLISGSSTILVTNCPAALAIRLDESGTNVVLNWRGDGWLQCAGLITYPLPETAWSNVIQGAKSGTMNFMTCPVNSTSQFFRLVAPTNSP